MTEPLADEAERILREYQRRAREIPADFYARTRPANLFAVQQRERHCLAALRRNRLLPVDGRRVLEIGCGAGGWLPSFEAWGVSRGNLAGIDLDPLRVVDAQRRLAAWRDEQGTVLAPGADVRHGDASHLPWGDGSFDIVVQSTVFTSILDGGMRRTVATEMLRVLRPGGVIFWYDFLYNNPRNPHVRGVGRREIVALFPGCHVDLRRITLAPPLARRLVPVTWLGAFLLEGIRLLNTHYLGIIRRPER